MFAHEFMRSAFLAGSAIAVVAGLVGYLLVLRVQVFAADALSHVAFTAAVAAAAAGLDTRVGLFAGTALVAAMLSALGTRAGGRDVAIGSVFVWVLGLGTLFLSILASSPSGAGGTTGVRVLFGSVFGLSASDARLAAIVAAAAVVAVLAIARPLLFASVDPDVAAGRGVPVRALGAVFLVIAGVAAAEATQAVGALLLLGLLSAPAGTARLLTPDPYRGLALSAALALAATWAGLALAYAVPQLPPSTAIVGVAGAVLAIVAVGSTLRGRGVPGSSRWRPRTGLGDPA